MRLYEIGAVNKGMLESTEGSAREITAENVPMVFDGVPKQGMTKQEWTSDWLCS
jgi:hypothetical protein